MRLSSDTSNAHLLHFISEMKSMSTDDIKKVSLIENKLSKAVQNEEPQPVEPRRTVEISSGTIFDSIDLHNI